VLLLDAAPRSEVEGSFRLVWVVVDVNAMGTRRGVGSSGLGKRKVVVVVVLDEDKEVEAGGGVGDMRATCSWIWSCVGVWVS
jgi:hypothetical protein